MLKFPLFQRYVHLIFLTVKDYDWDFADFLDNILLTEKND